MSDVFRDKSNKVKRLFQSLPAILGQKALEFFDRSWDQKGFADRTLNKWKPVIDSKSGREKQRPLVQTARLRRSLRLKTDRNSAIIYTDVEYAQIHNEGGTITGVANIKSHKRRTKNGVVDVSAHKRRVNTDIPQRQFMGASELLKKELRQTIVDQISKILQ